MSSPFLDVARAAVIRANKWYGEEWLWQPMHTAGDVRATPTADPDRVASTVRGIFFEKAAKPLIANGFDPRTSQRPGTAADYMRIEFSPACAAAGIEFRKGDLVTRVSNGRHYRIAENNPTVSSVQVCKVNLA